MGFSAVALKWWDVQVSKVLIGKTHVFLVLDVISAGENQEPDWRSINESISLDQYNNNPLKVGDKLRVRHIFEKAE